jgi:hypothetical protein
VGRPDFEQESNPWQGYGVTDHAISKLSGGRPLRTYDAGRTCAAPGCTTRLSAYNKNEYCWTHYQPVPKPARIPADN